MSTYKRLPFVLAIILVIFSLSGLMVLAQDATDEPAMSEGEAMVRSMIPGELPEGWTLPPSIGHVTNYLVHEWYQNETAGEAVRAEEHGIEFSINDANLDLQTS